MQHNKHASYSLVGYYLASSCILSREPTEEGSPIGNRRDPRSTHSVTGHPPDLRSLRGTFLMMNRRSAAYRERTGEEGCRNAGVARAGAFSIQRLEGSRFGMVVLWVLNGGATPRRRGGALRPG